MTVGSSRREGLDKAVIESFPVFEYSRVKDRDLKTGKEAVECVVCLREFEDDETLRLLPKCSHVFHHDCIKVWLAFHVTCPVCRAQLTGPVSDAKPGGSNTTVLNANSNTESSAPTTERNAYVVVEVDEGTQRGNFQRCHSTGHSVIQPGENVERFTLRLPEEMRKRITKRGKLKRTISCDALFGRADEEEEEEEMEGRS